MLQADSTTVREAAIPAAHDAHDAAAAGEQPVGGTPEGLPAKTVHIRPDSVLQSVFKLDGRALSTRPDTLHLPGQDKGRNLKEVNLPQYYREIFFAKDSLLHPELEGGRYGVAGDPVPYTIKGDSIITSLLLGCFILAMLSFSKSRRFIFKQVKSLFYEPREQSSELSETGSEVRFQFFLVAQTCLLLSISAFLYTQECVSDTFILESQYQLLAIFFGIFAAYFGLKTLLYLFVNNIFFGHKKSLRWLKLFVFVTSLEGVLLFPIVMLRSYFDLHIQNVIIYMTFVIILVKTTLLYKSFIIFFRHKSQFLQIILYFCALEIMPLLLSWGILTEVVDCLKINF